MVLVLVIRSLIKRKEMSERAKKEDKNGLKDNDTSHCEELNILFMCLVSNQRRRRGELGSKFNTNLNF